MYTGSSMPKKIEATTQIQGPPSTLVELFPLFYREKSKLKHVTPTTLKGYRHIIHWIFWLHDQRGIDRPDEMGHVDCVDHLIEYGDKGGRTHPDGTPWPVTDASVRQRRINIVMFENWLVNSGYASNTPMRLTTAPGRKSPKKMPTPIGDIDKILAVLDGEPSAPRDSAFLLASLDLGSRPSETLRLDISDIDLPTRTVHFRAENTKTQTARVGFLTEYTAAVLGWYWQRYGMTAGPAFAAIHTNGGERWRYEAMRRQMMDLSERAKLEHHLEAHSIRRAFATWMAVKIPMHAVALLLGHSLEGALGVTSRYVSLTEDQLREFHAANSPVLALKWVQELESIRWPDGGGLVPPIKCALRST